ncbi:hypothetical protein GBAR_LOCUS23918 [Geodia barretti]|uniref:Uncharacterized protein n=1 Tax=Geodia barretti TaxID=519541 RepID=A0AA35X847_GEOBA|nr:hypothetical protein GBAR_LOCUS23918 [Geodia barretti]
MTLGLGRNHQYTASGGYIAHCTGDIVVVGLRQRWHCSKPVLDRSHEILVSHSSDVLEIARIIWHAEIVGCPSLVIIPCPPSSSRVNQLCSLAGWTGGVSPASVDSSSNWQTLGSLFSLTTS